MIEQFVDVMKQYKPEMEFNIKDFSGNATLVFWTIKNKAEPGQLLSQPRLAKKCFTSQTTQVRVNKIFSYWPG